MFWSRLTYISHINAMVVTRGSQWPEAKGFPTLPHSGKCNLGNLIKLLTHFSKYTNVNTFYGTTVRELARKSLLISMTSGGMA
jgi:hypothetical protein